MDQAAFLNLISGRKRGPIATLQRALLAGCSPFYAAVVGLRNQLYNTHLKRIHQAAVPVVSVGNLTTGGTGKTPCVAWLAQWFLDRELQPVLLSRGYHALDNDVNDEKLVLDRLCPALPHLQHPNRVRSAEIACREHAAQLLILDDGFQHRRLGRDLDIVLIDALNPWGYDRILPRGLLRELPGNLRRADLVVLTRADQCTPEQRHAILARINKLRPQTQCIEVAFQPADLINDTGNRRPVTTLSGQPVLAFCGIGNPDAFRRTLDDCGMNVVCLRSFPDHHHYSADDLRELQSLAIKHNAAAVLTTLKDLVKINQEHIGTQPLWAINIQTRILNGEQHLQQALEQIQQEVGTKGKRC